MISVIVPIYNCENYLSACLDSLLNQTFSDFEIICVNDGSIDNSGAILKRYIEKDNRLKVFTISNHGQAYARNLGISNSQGEFICFVDSDDVVERTYLEKLFLSMEKDDSDLAVCDMYRVYKKKPNWLEKYFEYYFPIEAMEYTNVLDNPELILSIINAPYCKLIKKSYLESNQIWFMEGKIYEDFYFTQSLLASNPRISFVSEPLYHYFIYEGSTMTSKNSKVSDMYDIMESLIQLYVDRNLFVKFFEELEYLCIHHIAIGTVYRSTRQNWLSLLSERNKANEFLKKYNFSIQNKYCEMSSWFVKVYLGIMFIKK